MIASKAGEVGGIGRRGWETGSQVGRVAIIEVLNLNNASQLRDGAQTRSPASRSAAELIGSEPGNRCHFVQGRTVH